MKPRVVPRRIGITNDALAAAESYGQRGRYRQAMDRAQDQALIYLDEGLPEEFEPLSRALGRQAALTVFSIYVENVHGIYLGFAESVQGEWLRLVALSPSDQVSLDEMLELTEAAI
jgi:hypothetical protein